MSVEDAHAFIRHLREHAEEPGTRDSTSMAAVIEAGRAAGYTFDEEDLRAAHLHDWLLRWLALRTRGRSPEGSA